MNSSEKGTTAMGLNEKLLRLDVAQLIFTRLMLFSSLHAGTYNERTPKTSVAAHPDVFENTYNSLIIPEKERKIVLW